MSFGIGKVIQIDGEDFDVWIEFEVLNYHPGYRGDWNNPPEAAEYELAFVSAVFDPPGEAKIPETILVDLEDWFNKSSEAQHRASEVAEDYYSQSFYEDRYDRYDD
jgi:hypothetical protein